jgi:ABC-type multidrug transport system permease subunit
MNIFKLYFYRIFKKKLSLLLVIILPIIMSLSVVAQYKSFGSNNLGVYCADENLEKIVLKTMSAPKLTINKYKSLKSLKKSSDDLKVQLIQPKSNDFKSYKDITVISQNQKDTQNSSFLKIKVNSVLSVISDIASSSDSKSDFNDKIRKFTNRRKIINVHKIIIGNKNANILTSTFNFIVFLLIFMVMTNSMLFLKDKTTGFTKRLMVTTTKSSYILQSLLVFSIIGIIQFIIINTIMVVLFKVKLYLNFEKIMILLFAFLICCMLFTAVGLILTSLISKLSTGRQLISVITLPIAMLGGTLWPVTIMPKFMQDFAHFLPTYWLTQINDQIFSGLTQNNVIYTNLAYLILLFFVTLTVLLKMSARKM